MSTSASDTKALFFGEFGVRFAPLDGSVLATPPGSLSAGSDVAAGVAFLELVGDRKVKLEAPPNAPVVFDREASAAAADTIPAALRVPLIKTADGSLSGIRSGGRSAILLDDGAERAYRLKGCGNYVDADGFRFEYPGFPTRDWMLWGEWHGTELRGCCWEHTALRELYMSRWIGELIEAEAKGLVGPVANLPIGLWVYEMPDGQPERGIKRCCGLFETLADKRLGHHLLPGLDLCITALLREHLTTSDDSLMQSVRARFDRRHFEQGDADTAAVRPTWAACCTGTSPATPTDFYCDRLPESTAGLVELADEFGVAPRWRELWRECIDVLANHLPLESHSPDTPAGSLLAAVHWRIGREAGRFKRLLRDHQISWGYFCDHDTIEPHCNAHPSNFVVLPVTPHRVPGSPLLGPVDFDLAYERTSFFSTIRESPLFGTFDQELFDAWLDSEDSELARALAGEAASTGLLGVSVHIEDECQQTIKWAMRDTLLAGYRSGYEKQDEPHPIPLHLEPAVEALIKLALILTAERQS